MRFRCAYAHLVSAGLVQAVYRPVRELPAQTTPWPAAAPLATVMSCQPCQAWQAKLLSVAHVVSNFMRSGVLPALGLAGVRRRYPVPGVRRGWAGAAGG